MTHVVVDGAPTKAQKYMENIIQELISETGRSNDRHSFTRILYKCLRDNPERQFMLEGISGVELKNKEVLQDAVKVAKALKSLGIQRGDTACFISWNSVEFAKVFYGCLFAGVVNTSIVDLATSYEICHCLKTSNAKIIFSEQHKLNDVQKALKDSKIDCPVVLLNCKNNDPVVTYNGIHYKDFISNQNDSVGDFLPVETEPDDVMVLTLTSGSTGLGVPKLAMTTYKSFVAQAATPWAIYDVPHPTRMMFLMFSAQWMANVFIFLTFPIFGVPLLVTSESPSYDTLINCFRKYQPSQICMVPSEMIALLKSTNYRRGDLHCLDTFIVMGSACSETALARVQAELREDAIVLNRYAMTETAAFVCLSQKDTTPSSVGRVVNIFHYKIVDTDGKEITVPYKSGELRLKSDYAISKGYLGSPEATAEMRDENGWFCTGDIFYRNDIDELFFEDRKKFIIMAYDYPVPPTEIENVVCGVEGVMNCVVCGVQSGIVALVVRSPGSEVNEQQIKNAVKEKLNMFKQITGGVLFVDALPTSHNRKILRHKCKELAERLLAEKSTLT